MHLLYILASLLIVLETDRSLFPLKDAQKTQIISPTTYLPDPTHQLTIREVMRAFEKGGFERSPETLFGDTSACKTGKCNTRVYWLHFSIHNTTEFDQQWILDFQDWSYVDAYLIRNGKVADTLRTGHLFSYWERNYPVANKAYLLLPIRLNEVQELFVRLESRFNNEIIPQNLDFTVAPRAVVDKKSDYIGKAIYSFLSVFFVMFLYNFFVYSATRLRSYGYYLIVIFFAFYHTAYNSGYLIEIFGFIDSFPTWLTHFEKFSSILLGISVTLFVSEYLTVKKRYPFWSKVINWIIVAFVISAALVVINVDLGTIVSILIGIGLIITIIALAIKSIRDRYPVSVYFLIGYSAFLSSTFMIMLTDLRILPKNDWTRSFSYAAGSTIEIIFFSFALANLINVLRRENEENLKLQQKYIQEKEAMQQAFQHELMRTQLEIQEQTLGAVGRELHDNIGQLLSLIRLNISTINIVDQITSERKISNSKELIDKAIEDMRTLSKTLTTDFISKVGLANAIKLQLQMLLRTGLFEINFSESGTVFHFPASQELFIFRIVQELINNTVKHADATAIHIIVSYQDNTLRLRVHDNGKGIDPQQWQDPKNTGQGLRNIRNRITLLNGIIYLENSIDPGTTFIIEIPK